MKKSFRKDNSEADFLSCDIFQFERSAFHLGVISATKYYFVYHRLSSIFCIFSFNIFHIFHIFYKNNYYLVDYMVTDFMVTMVTNNFRHVNLLEKMVKKVVNCN